MNSVAVETQWGKNTGREGGRGRSRGNVCANDFEKLHVGLEGGKKKNVLIEVDKRVENRVRLNYRKRERGGKKSVFLFELRQ